jgi:hypothetical protein
VQQILIALTCINLVAVSCALWAAITARSSLKALRRKLAERSTRSLRQLDAEIASMSATLGSLSTTVRRLSSKYGMQDVRARRKEESPRMPSDLTPSEKKAWLRRELQAGRLQVSRDGVVVAAAGQKSDDE